MVIIIIIIATIILVALVAVFLYIKLRRRPILVPYTPPVLEYHPGKQVKNNTGDIYADGVSLDRAKDYALRNVEIKGFTYDNSGAATYHKQVNNIIDCDSQKCGPGYGLFLKK